MKLDIDNSRKVTKPDFWKKIWFIKYENVVKMMVFGHFFKFKIFQIFLYCKCRQQGSIWSICKKPHVKINFLSGDIHPQSSNFRRKRQSGVQRSLYISRTVNGTENLIRYSEFTENFLSCTFHHIFAYVSSSGWKFDPKIGNFHLKTGFFEQFSGIFSVTTWKIRT